MGNDSKDGFEGGWGDGSDSEESILHEDLSSALWYPLKSWAQGGVTPELGVGERQIDPWSSLAGQPSQQEAPGSGGNWTPA